MDDFQKEVIERLTRIETKQDTAPCLDHGLTLENQNKEISKLRQKIDNKVNATKIWLLVGIVGLLSSTLGAILLLWLEKITNGG